MIILARFNKLVPDKPVPLNAVLFISFRKLGFVFNTFYLMINYLAALSEPKMIDGPITLLSEQYVFITFMFN